MKDDLGNWIILFVSMAVSVLGLVLAARGDDIGMVLAGWLFFVFGVGLCFRFAAKMSAAPEEN